MSASSHPDDPAPDHPPVSVVMPVLNEGRHLRDAVAQILRQGYAGDLEVVLALGPSSDDTDEIAAGLAAADARVRTVPNPSGRTPSALNAAITAARHAIVVRVDGHAEIPSDYVATAVRVLEETGADNVGGLMLAEGRTAFEKAVACAMRSRIGVGGGSFHVGGAAGPVDTVYLGSFRRSALERVGGFDERYTRTQDWQLNHQIRRTGGVVWFTPEMAVTYRPRSTLRALSRQYLEYGRWRRVVAHEHPETLSARYLAPPVALIACAAGLVGGALWAPLWAIPAMYAVGVGVGGLAVGASEGASVAVRVPAVLATMHGSWAWGFLTSRPDHLLSKEKP